MKKIAILFLVLFAFGVQAQNRSKIESAPSLTWFGLDFTKARMVGSSVDFNDPARIVSTFMGEWNQLFIKEAKKFDLEGAFRKRIIHNTEQAAQRNAGVDYLKLVTEQPNTVTEAEAAEVVRDYTAEDGIGLVFVIENFDKPAKKTRFWVVIFDVKTHEVLLAKETVNEVGGGIGFRNFWASGLYSGIKTIREIYPKWLKSLK